MSGKGYFNNKKKYFELSEIRITLCAPKVLLFRAWCTEDTFTCSVYTEAFVTYTVVGCITISAANFSASFTRHASCVQCTLYEVL